MVRSSRGKLTTGGWEEVGDKMEDDMEVDDEDENMNSEHKQNSGGKSRYKLEWRFILNILKLGLFRNFSMWGGGQHLLGPKNPLKTIEVQGGGISRPSESFDFIGYGFYIRWDIDRILPNLIEAIISI